MFEIRAERLQAIARLLTNDVEPNSDGESIFITEYSLSDDALSPIPLDPSERDLRAEARNFMANAMPTTIERRTSYSVMPGENGVKLIVDTTIVDRGKKTPVIDFTNQGDDAIDATADYLAAMFSANRQQAPAERRGADFNRMILQTLLGREKVVIDLNEVAIQRGVIDVSREDLLTGQIQEQQEPVTLPTLLGSTVEFDLLQALRQREFKWDLNDARRVVVQELAANFKY